jgi:phosphate-selective porin
MRLPMTIVLAAALLAFSQGDAERLRRLEDQVKKQQAEIDELKNQRASESEWSATFTEGLHWRTKDGEFDIHVGGRFEEQYRHVFSRPDASRTQPDSFYVREAFLSADGSLARDFFFRINGDFTSSIAGPGANLEEAYLEWKGLPEFQLRFGQFRTPNSQETLTSTLFTDCIERSMLSRFVPEVEPGIQAAGEIERGLVTYQIAVINGRAEPSSSGRSTNDNNDEKDLLARITVSPFESDYFRYLRLGVYGSIGDASDVPMDSQFDLTTTELGVTYFDSTAGFLDGRRWRAGESK